MVKDVLNLLNDIPALRKAWYMLLVALWLGATIANIAYILGIQVQFAGLAGISVFSAVMLVRALRDEARA